jgi:hypothetical protein
VDVSIYTALSWDGGDPNSADTVYYEVYLGQTPTPPLFDTTPTYPAGQTRISYDPGTLGTNTSYYWQVKAYDNQGESAAGPVWQFITGDVPPPVFLTGQDIPVQNGGISGDHTLTHETDDLREGISERESGGKPSKRYSYLEHKWTIEVAGGYSQYVFKIEAHHTANSEGDDFVFAYSTDDGTYTDMVTVTKTSDDGIYQTYSLPASLSGTVYIRVKDTDQSQGNRSLDTVYIDHMYIEGI